jgi:hypothetical protein
VHQDQAVVKAEGFCLKDVGLLIHECVSEGEGLRKKILSKTHHSPYVVHPRSIKMYKDEHKSELEYSTYLSSSSLLATLGNVALRSILWT